MFLLKYPTFILSYF